MSDPIHLETDELVELCAALRWDPETWLAHLAGCADCRQALGELGLVHGSFAADEVPAELYVRIDRSLAAAAAPAVPAPGRPAPWPARVVVALTAFTSLAVFGMINPLSAGAVVPAALIGLAAAALATREHAPGSPAARLLAAL